LFPLTPGVMSIYGSDQGLAIVRFLRFLCPVDASAGHQIDRGWSSQAPGTPFSPLEAVSYPALLHRHQDGDCVSISVRLNVPVALASGLRRVESSPCCAGRLRPGISRRGPCSAAERGDYLACSRLAPL